VRGHILRARYAARRIALTGPGLVKDAPGDQSGRGCIATPTPFARPQESEGSPIQHLGGDRMPGSDGPLVVLGLLVVLLLFRIPATRRLLFRLARQASDWVRAHCTGTEERDQDEDQLWLMERRRRLCADLRRVEHLLATDTWMSATRQRGNRIAYDRLVDDLRHTPEVFPTIFQPQIFDPFDGSATEPRWRLLANDGPSGQRRTVEVLEIGWRRRRN
jgi:hypothetical protein